MFNISPQIDRNLEEGIVMEVDAKRMICKVNTSFGKKLSRVKWILQYGGSSRAGDRGTPTQGDRVIVSYGSGYPLIIGFLPELEGAVRDDSGVIVEESSVDTGNFSGVTGNNVSIDINKPKDFLAGDRIISTIGGAMLGLLRGGSILLRSGPFSEIFISKFMNLVRVASGNWEHFTDVCSDVIKNYRGRIYRYTGYTNSFLSSKAENYSYHEYTGDTALAEAMKTSYHEDMVPPAQNSIIRKEQVKVGGVETMHRSLGLDGFEETVITNAGGITKIRSNGTEVYISHNDDNWIKVYTDGIHIEDQAGAYIKSINGVITLHKGSSTLEITDSAITISSPTINLNGNVLMT